MKVVLINGSPNVQGCTYTALKTCADALNAAGIETEILHIGMKAIQGCIGCFRCSELHKCVFDDIVNRYADTLAEADGMVLGSPVYFSSPNASMLAFLDRLYASAGERLMFKPCACVVSARRAGTTLSLAALQQYPLVNEQPLVASSYWNMVHGNTPEEVLQDTEGLHIMRNIGRDMAWLLRCLEAAKENGIPLPTEA